MRMPVAFLQHGGGPWPFVDLGFPRGETEDMRAYLEKVRELTPEKPKAIVVVSAHWEAPVPTVMSSDHPPMLYDYYGFPPESYRVTWPAPGNPTLAARVRKMLGEAGFETAQDRSRGYDHGTFVPLKVTYPEADIPVVQLSLIEGLDPEEHLRMGKALTPLRDEGVFIVGSGNTFHNLRAMRDPRAPELSAKFDDWLKDVVSSPASQREAKLKEWASAPSGRFAHPREEHLIPLLFAAGAAGDDAGHTTWTGKMMGTRISGFHFGA